MRKALTLLVLGCGLVAGGCHSYTGEDSCNPRKECCNRYQPNCCNSWDFYVPCDMIEGRATREASGTVSQLPTCECK